MTGAESLIVFAAADEERAAVSPESSTTPTPQMLVAVLAIRDWPGPTTMLALLAMPSGLAMVRSPAVMKRAALSSTATVLTVASMSSVTCEAAPEIRTLYWSQAVLLGTTGGDQLATVLQSPAASAHSALMILKPANDRSGSAPMEMKLPPA